MTRPAFHLNGKSEVSWGPAQANNLALAPDLSMGHSYVADLRGVCVPDYSLLSCGFCPVPLQVGHCTLRAPWQVGQSFGVFPLPLKVAHLM